MIPSKADAKKFLQRLERFLNAGLPEPTVMRGEVDALVKVAKETTDQRHKAFPEGAVLNHFVVPLIARFLRDEAGLDDEPARKALLSESYRRCPEIASGTPARSAHHPFSKVIGMRPEQVVAQWKGRTKVPRVARSCPDLALRDPAPHRVVFEAKYFRNGSDTQAEKELATGIYQAFFYRGLPTIEEKEPRPSWSYDYACLLVCDGSQDGKVVKAWADLPRAVRNACWDGANVYVMVLHGSRDSARPTAYPSRSGER